MSKKPKTDSAGAGSGGNGGGVKAATSPADAGGGNHGWQPELPPPIEEELVKIRSGMDEESLQEARDLVYELTSEGDRVRISMIMRGRQMRNKNQYLVELTEFIESLDSISMVGDPKLRNRFWTVLVASSLKP